MCLLEGLLRRCILTGTSLRIITTVTIYSVISPVLILRQLLKCRRHGAKSVPGRLVLIFPQTHRPKLRVREGKMFAQSHRARKGLSQGASSVLLTTALPSEVSTARKKYESRTCHFTFSISHILKIAKNKKQKSPGWN